MILCGPSLFGAMGAGIPFTAVPFGVLGGMGANAADLQDMPEQGIACQGKLFLKAL